MSRGPSSHTRILIGLAAGAAAGLAANFLVAGGFLSSEALAWTIRNATRPLGQVFLNLLFMVVIPLVFCSLSLGVVSLGRVGRLGRLSLVTFSYFIVTTVASGTLGLLLVNVFRPGEGFDPEARARLLESFGEDAAEKVGMARFSVDLFVEIVSRNPLRDAVEGRMLPVIFFAVLFGVALTRIRGEESRAVTDVLQAVSEAMVEIVGLAMRLAPYAVAALIFNVTALLGWQLLKQLALFVVLVFAGYALHQFGTYSLLVRYAARYPPRLFFRRITPVMVTAFTTSSSNATLPTTIRHAQESLGVPAHIAGFVLPLGATANMNGTSLFEGVVVLFLAQVFGIELSLGTQVLVVLLTVLTAVGAAGVPSGAIPLLVGVLETVGIPGEGIAIVLGVDRILDMGRTVLNVTGDLTAACFVARTEGYPLRDEVGALEAGSM